MLTESLTPSTVGTIQSTSDRPVKWVSIVLDLITPGSFAGGKGARAWVELKCCGLLGDPLGDAVSLSPCRGDFSSYEAGDSRRSRPGSEPKIAGFRAGETGFSAGCG